jgi:hypothetical protein
MTIRRTSSLALMAVLLASCGILQPTPAYFRPPLPDAQQMPDLQVEDAVAELLEGGFECEFDPPGDIGSSRGCRRGDQEGGDYMAVTFRSAETGPIETVSTSRTIRLDGDTGPEPSVLDAAAAADFHEILIEMIVPEAQSPTEEGMLAGVQSNYPVDLGDGWFLSFDRNAVSRSMNIVFNADEGLVLPEQ